MQTDFESRLTDGTLSPADVPRNRIYPTGAAMGVLLDFFGVDWKHQAANLPEASTLADLLAPSIPVPTAGLVSLQQEADRRYALPQLRQRTQSLADAYVREADAAIRAFEAQSGHRVAIISSLAAPWTDSLFGYAVVLFATFSMTALPGLLTGRVLPDVVTLSDAWLGLSVALSSFAIWRGGVDLSWGFWLLCAGLASSVVLEVTSLSTSRVTPP